MSALQDAIRQRRSIRRFRRQPIPESLLLQVLDAGRWAPSAGNTQPWRMILITEAEIIGELIDIMARYLDETLIYKGSAEDEDVELLTSAPVFIVVCMTKDVFGKLSDRWMSEHTMGVQSVATAIQNMLLVAHDVGLGGCWRSTPLLCPTAIRQTLGIPQGIEPQAVIAIGYPDDKPEPPRRKQISEVIYLNRWNHRYTVPA